MLTLSSPICVFPRHALKDLFVLIACLTRVCSFRVSGAYLEEVSLSEVEATSSLFLLVGGINNVVILFSKPDSSWNRFTVISLEDRLPIASLKRPLKLYCSSYIVHQ